MPQAKNARLLIPDPENELDFYTLSKLFPLADQALDGTLIPSPPTKPSSSTQSVQSPHLSPSVAAFSFSLAKTAPVSSGQITVALENPIASPAATEATCNAAILARSNLGFTATLDPNQLMLMEAVALKHEQSRLHKNALPNAALMKSLVRNNEHFHGGFPF